MSAQAILQIQRSETKLNPELSGVGADRNPIAVSTLMSNFPLPQISAQMTNITIEKPGDGVFIVKIIGNNRASAEKELKEFIAGRAFTRYVDHFNPNNQIIQLLPSTPEQQQHLLDLKTLRDDADQSAIAQN